MVDPLDAIRKKIIIEPNDTHRALHAEHVMSQREHAELVFMAHNQIREPETGVPPGLPRSIEEYLWDVYYLERVGYSEKDIAKILRVPETYVRSVRAAGSAIVILDEKAVNDWLESWKAR